MKAAIEKLLKYVQDAKAQGLTPLTVTELFCYAKDQDLKDALESKMINVGLIDGRETPLVAVLKRVAKRIPSTNPFRDPEYGDHDTVASRMARALLLISHGARTNSHDTLPSNIIKAHALRNRDPAILASVVSLDEAYQEIRQREQKESKLQSSLVISPAVNSPLHHQASHNPHPQNEPGATNGNNSPSNTNI